MRKNVIDNLGVGNKRKNRDKNKQSFDDLYSYLLSAKKIISIHAPLEVRAEMIGSEDVISNVAYLMMTADWQWNGKGTKLGFRKERGIYAIRDYLSRRGKGKFKTLSLNSTLVSTSNQSFIDILADEDKGPRESAETRETKAKLNGKLSSLEARGIITPLGHFYLVKHYIEGVSVEEIAESRDISRQAVYQIINPTLLAIKTATAPEDF